mmetsp:Transcript_30223/g.96435  ORF Transcript_30223/g.96435 Transcript_30223/m.96435 type:complete len:667 (-) Transcript_30223:1884-3884(-)
MDSVLAARLVAASEPTAFPTESLRILERQASLQPIKINGKDYVQLALIKQTATSLVHKACAPRDNTRLDAFAHGERNICVVKKVRWGDDDVQAANRARDELEILQSLGDISEASKHVVMLLAFDNSQASELKLVMECGDRDLGNWTPRSSYQMLDALQQAIAALEWMHDVGRVVHLDIKPANFLLFPTMNIKLADFGTATRLDDDGATLTSEVPFAGTLDYLAPEALGLLSADGQCSASASAATDVWAMGVMIHAMIFVNARLPFPENGLRCVAAQRRAVTDAPALNAEEFLNVITDIGPSCLELTRACLRPAPADRPSAASLLQKLKSSCYAQIMPSAQSSAAVSPLPSELPPYSAKYDSTMPPGWERVDRADGRSCYVDHINRRTTWVAPTIESSSREEPPAIVHESSSISMLSVASQETFQSSHEKLDLLFKILSYVPLIELFRARRVCQSWKQRIDGADGKGREWWEICKEHVPAMTRAGYDQNVDWKEISHIASFLWSRMAAPHLFTTTNDNHIVTAEWMTVLLGYLRRAAMIAACKGILFKQFFSLRSGFVPQCHQLMYTAFTQSPPNNLSALAYDWWCSSTPEIAAEIKATLTNEPQQLRVAAVDSFDSYIKKMTTNVLDYLDRFYIPRLSLRGLIAVAAPVQAQLRTALQVPPPVDVA